MDVLVRLFILHLVKATIRTQRHLLQRSEVSR